ncbi:hypothetical protein ACFU8W_18025 [Streptomyces sp. NPDC057565]|uniref:hypothetical protein n=1 Tax=Streptomyces sp. NPDC057565 TaxID=3346169 RepID=UPI0036D05888
MTRYLISFDDGAMTFPEEELPEVPGSSTPSATSPTDAHAWRTCLGRYLFNIKASGPGQGLRPFRDPEAIEDDADDEG